MASLAPPLKGFFFFFFSAIMDTEWYATAYHDIKSFCPLCIAFWSHLVAFFVYVEVCSDLIRWSPSPLTQSVLFLTPLSLICGPGDYDQNLIDCLHIYLVLLICVILFFSSPFTSPLIPSLPTSSLSFPEPPSAISFLPRAADL